MGETAPAPSGVREIEERAWRATTETMGAVLRVIDQKMILGNIPCCVKTDGGPDAGVQLNSTQLIRAAHAGVTARHQ